MGCRGQTQQGSMPFALVFSMAMKNTIEKKEHNNRYTAIVENHKLQLYKFYLLCRYNKTYRLD
jgi:hypothetical protein